MQLATNYLRNGTESIASVANRVGYDSEAAFSRAFKKSVGTPPSEWRVQHVHAADAGLAPGNPSVKLIIRSEQRNTPFFAVGTMRSIPTKEHIMSIRLIKLLPVAACLALSGVAAASTPKDLPSVVVKYGDLNLDSQAGVRKPARPPHECREVRVQLARQPRARPARTVRPCVTDAVKQSVAAVGNADLIRYHRYGGRVRATGWSHPTDFGLRKWSEACNAARTLLIQRPRGISSAAMQACLKEKPDTDRRARRAASAVPSAWHLAS